MLRRYNIKKLTKTKHIDEVNKLEIVYALFAKIFD